MEATLTQPVVMNTARYGGFWIRLVAVIIDYIILGFVQFVVIAPILTAMGLVSLDTPVVANPEDGAAMVAAIMGMMGVAQGISLVVGFLYFTLMESSKNGATVGKMALGLKVVDAEGNTLSFGKAALRYVGRIVSMMIFLIGYIMAAFTSRKQALHDMIAGTYVIKK